MGPYALIPEESLWGLIPMVVYLIWAFRPNTRALTSAFLACLVGFFLTGQTPAMFGQLMSESLGSTLGVIGLIIMLGAGLGELMTETHVSHVLVNWIINKVGVNTEKRAIIATITVTVVVCGLLGTLAGGCALIAPILIPVVAAAGLKPSSVGAVFQSAGETGIIWGPFTGPTVTLLALTGLSYGRMMLWAALPFGIIWLIVIYFVALHIQKNPKYDDKYELEETEIVEVTKKDKIATVVFMITFVALVAYSLLTGQGTSYTIFVMIVLSLVLTIFSTHDLNVTFKVLGKGMASMAGTFLLFLFLNVMMTYVNYGGGFTALGNLFMGFVGEGSKAMLMIIGTIVGAFGVNGAAVAQMKVTHELFLPAVTSMNLPMEMWAIVLIAASRITSSIYPGTNMISPMGLARSKSLKAMLVGGWAVSMTAMLYIFIWAFVGQAIF